MENLFVLMLLLSIALLIIGVFNPAISLFWYKKEKTRKLSALIYSGLMILFFILFGVTSDSKKSTTEDGKSISVSNEKEVSSNSNNTGQKLFSSVEEFKNIFNEYCQSKGLDFRINSVKLEEGEVNNSFSYMLTDNIGLIGSINKSDETIKSITMIGSGDGSLESGSDMILCMATIISSVDPTLPEDRKSEVFKKLKLIGDKAVDFTNMSQNTIMNGIKYTVTSNPNTGVMFTASVPGN